MSDDQDLLIATYHIRQGAGQGITPAEQLAEQMAVGMTVGSWTDLPALHQERLRRYRGIVLGVERIEGPGEHHEPREVVQIRIGYPSRNLPPNLSAALTVAFGKISLDGDIRLVGLDLPTSWTAALPGPSHGIEGLRKRLRVTDRPLLMSIFKSENGRTLEEFRGALRDQWLGGADLVKDDEIFFADEAAPARDRIQVAREVEAEAEGRWGRRPLYALNLTAAGPNIVDQAARWLEWGAEAFLVAPWTVGLDTLSALARLPGAPMLLAHPAFSGAFIGSGTRGVAPSIALGTLVRAAGADIGIFPSAYGTVALAAEDARAVGEALTVPGPRRPAWPAPSAGIHPGLVRRLLADFGSDVIINAGGAIHGHPGGTQAGALAFRQALDRVGRNDQAAPPPELAAALARWGGDA